MLVNENNEMEKSLHNFYSPISKYAYLTPLQRKKMRERRNINSLSQEINEGYKVVKPKAGGVRKPKHSGLKTNKLKTKRKVVPKKWVNVSLPEVRCTAAQLISQNKSIVEGKKNKFFKTRSPEHFKKANFVVPLTYKKKSLDFSERKYSPPRTLSKSLIKTDIPTGADLENSVEDIEVKNENGISNANVCATTHSPTVIRVCSTCEKSASSPVFKNGESEVMSPDNDNNSNVLDMRNVCLKVIEKPIGFMEHVDDFELRHDTVLSDTQNKSKSVLTSTTDSISPRNSDEIISLEEEKSPTTTNQKFYPLFYKKTEKRNKSNSAESPISRKVLRLKDTSKGCYQMIIDAGQKEIGAKQCKTCSMIYTIGEEEDEKLHSKYHDMYLANLKFPGWKKEKIIGEYPDGRIIKIQDDDKNFKLKKIQDVLLIANRDLGFSSAGFPVRPNVSFLLFISNDKRVRGCLVAESITAASPVVLDEMSNAKDELENGKVVWKLGCWYASSESVPAICGINRIWVAKEYRRHKVASRMIDCLRSNFIYGHVVSLQELAFTDPSPDGREFAAFYTGTDNFLVYK